MLVWEITTKIRSVSKKQGGNIFNWTFLAELLAKSGEYNAVFHGHTHDSKNETLANSLLLNPGAVCGVQKGKPGIASYAIYDTATNTAEIIKI